MKRILAIILAFVLMFSLVTVNTFAEEMKAEYDFKKFRWGDSKEQVIAIEGTPFAENKMHNRNLTYIVYKTKAVDMDVKLFYGFSDEGLTLVLYTLQEKHSNGALYIEDYEKFKEALTKKYGDPVDDKEEWLTDSMKEIYKNSKGYALENEYVEYKTTYVTDRTLIVMTMQSDNYKISTSISYASFDIGWDYPDYSDEI